MPKSDRFARMSKGSDVQILGRYTKVDSEDLLNQYGASGTNIVDGYINEEYNRDLSGFRGMSTYDKMRKSDSQVFATLLACELPIRATKRFIDSATDDDDDVGEKEKDIAWFVENALFNKMETTRNDLLTEIMTMLAFGFSIFEKVYTTDGKNTYFQKLASRKQTSVTRWKTLANEAGVTQLLPTNHLMPEENRYLAANKIGEVSIPARKLVVFTFRKEGDNYQGTSLLRAAYKNWFMKDRFYKFDAIRQERLSVGIPVIYLPKNASTGDKAEALEIVTNIRTTEQTGVVIPGPKEDGWLFEFAQTHADKNTNIFESINHHNREISKTILAQFLELGATQSGSYALSQDQSTLFMNALQAIAQDIADIFNRYVIPELVDLNFDGVKDYPKLKFSKLGDIDYEKIATSLEKLANSQVLIPDDKLEDHIRDAMELPKRETDSARKKDIAADPKPAAVVPEAPEEEKPKEVKAHEHDHGEHLPSVFNDEYWDISQMFDNDMIVKIQNECRTAEDYAEVKKKGYSFNEYEDIAWRPLTFAERKVNLVSLKKTLQQFEGLLSEKINDISTRMKEDILKQVKRAVEGNDIKALGTISAKYTGELSQAITDVQKELFESGKKSAAAEMGVKVPPTKNEVKGAMRVQNDIIVEKYAGKMQADAKQAAIQVVGTNAGSITATAATAAVSAADEAMTAAVAKIATSVTTLAVTGAINMGRATIYERYPEKVYGFQYSAILDDATTDICRSLDGRVVKPGSAEFKKYSPPRHYNCRSIRVEILQDEVFKPEFTGIPSSIPANQSIDTAKKMDRPILMKSSPAIQQVQKELEQRKEQLEQYKVNGMYPNRQKQHEARIKELETSLEKAFFEFNVAILMELGVEFK